jgi:glycosyltransferase involved in cell wall biosynthesis
MSSSEPFVSIVTPFYNTAAYLGEAIASVLAQSHTNFEYILVNNKSTDGARDIALAYANKDPRIKLFDNLEFVGQMENYNAALKRISPDSKYVKIVQADDVIYPECVASMVAVAEREPGIGLVSAYYLYGEEPSGGGMPRDAWHLPGKEACRRMLLTKSFLVGTPSTVMYRADIVRQRDPFYPLGRYHADTETAYQIMLEHDLGFVHQVLSFVRSDNDGITPRRRAYNPGPLDYLIVIEQYGRSVLSPAEFEELSKREWEGYWGFLGVSALQFRSPDFWEYHRGGLATIGRKPEVSEIVQSTLKRLGRLALSPLRKVRLPRAGQR